MLYMLSRASMELWRWTGISRKTNMAWRTWRCILSPLSKRWMLSVPRWGWVGAISAPTCSAAVCWFHRNLPGMNNAFKWNGLFTGNITVILHWIIKEADVLYRQKQPGKVLKITMWRLAGSAPTFDPFPNQRSAWLRVSNQRRRQRHVWSMENVGYDKTVMWSSTEDIKRYRQWYLLWYWSRKIKQRKSSPYRLVCAGTVSFPFLEFSNRKF